MKKTVYVVTVEEVNRYVYTVESTSKEDAGAYAAAFLEGNNNGRAIIASSCYGPEFTVKAIRTEER